MGPVKSSLSTFRATLCKDNRLSPARAQLQAPDAPESALLECCYRRSLWSWRVCQWEEEVVVLRDSANSEKVVYQGLNIGNGKSHNVPITSALSDMFHTYIRNFCSFEKQNELFYTQNGVVNKKI